MDPFLFLLPLFLGSLRENNCQGFELELAKPAALLLKWKWSLLLFNFFIQDQIWSEVEYETLITSINNSSTSPGRNGKGEGKGSPQPPQKVIFVILEGWNTPRVTFARLEWSQGEQGVGTVHARPGGRPSPSLFFSIWMGHTQVSSTWVQPSI